MIGPLFHSSPLLQEEPKKDWHKETILRVQALKEQIREKVNGPMEYCGDPAYVRAACEARLELLGVKCVDLYYQHRIDNRLPIEITMGALKEWVEEEKIKYVGLSEASPSTIRRAHVVHPLTSIQL